MKNTMLRKSFKILEKIADLTLLDSALGHLPGFDFQGYPLLLLQVIDQRIRRHIG
jgi:hypothetical protein